MSASNGVVQTRYYDAPLRVRSTTKRHQSPERSILSQFSGFMQLQIQGRETAFYGLHPGSMWPPRWTSPALGRMLKNDLAVVCILIHSHKMSKERKTTRLDNGWEWWTIVIWQTSSFLTKSCQWMSRILCQDHRSSALIRCRSALLTAQHSDPLSIMLTLTLVIQQWEEEEEECQQHLLHTDTAPFTVSEWVFRFLTAHQHIKGYLYLGKLKIQISADIQLIWKKVQAYCILIASNFVVRLQILIFSVLTNVVSFSILIANKIFHVTILLVIYFCGQFVAPKIRHSRCHCSVCQ